MDGVCTLSQGNLDYSFYEQLVKQIPGLIVVMDINSKFIFSNRYTAQLFGYSSEDSMLGIDAFAMRCPAVECAEQFILQDKVVIEKNTILTILDVHSYADNQQKLLLTKKTPLFINDKLSGTICLCTEIHATDLAKISTKLVDMDRKYYSSQKGDERSYTLGTAIPNTALSQRELDCLFYIIRGASMKEVAKQLALSPRTVETYIKNIKYKWNCEKKSHIIDYAIANGYLGYVPERVLGYNLSEILNQQTHYSQ